MKKILFSGYSLDLGGIEKALVTLANMLQERGYDITTVLEKKEGVFLNDLNENIKLVEYRPSETKNIIRRKIVNLYKRIRFILKYKNKYDFSVCFATYSNSSAFVARNASKNNCLWGHADYLTLFENNINEMKKFFEEKKYKKFRNIVFVSKEGKDSFLKVFPEMEDRTSICNNLIDNENIIEMSKEKIDIAKDKNKITFVNIGRHEEKQKKLTRIIMSAKKLKNENYNFRILFVGDGPDTEKYKKIVKEESLEDVIIFLGKKKNPYPYYKIADCVILSSDYEGYPVVFLESFVLEKPVITTKVSDYSEIEGRGLIAEKSEKDIYEKMKNYIETGFKIERKFDANKYNEDIINKIEKLANFI